MISVEALRSACLAGDLLESARRLLSAELDKDAGLGAAASAGDVARVAAWLVEETPLLEVIGPLVSPEVAALAPTSMAKRLIWNRADLTADGAMLSEMSLGAAIRRGHLEALRLMIARGADINAPQADGNTPLVWAKQHGQPEIAGLLAQHGARLWPLDFSAVRKKFSVTVPTSLRALTPENFRAVEDLLYRVSEDEIKRICKAASEGDIEAVEALLQQVPALVHSRDHFQNTPLHHAATEAVVELLVARGADVNARGHMRNMPLHDAASHGHLEAARALIRHGAEVNALRDANMTALHFASLSSRAADNAAVAALLLDNGANLEARDVRGKTPLAEAAFRGQADVLEVLLARGADPNVHNAQGATPLHLAAKEGSAPVTSLLLAAGAKREEPDDNGDTPLHVAARRGRVEVLRLLLSAGVDVTRRNHDGDTAAQVAKDNNRREALDLLRQHQAQAGVLSVADPPWPVLVRTHPHKAEAVSLGRHGTVTRWTLESGEPRVAVHLETEHAGLRDLAVAPDGKFIVLAADQTLEVRRWDDLALARAIPNPTEGDYDGPEALALSPDGRWLAVAGGGEQIHLLDIETGEQTARVDGGERTGPLRFSPDSQWLASACSFQGGAHVRVDRVEADGVLTPLHEISRSDYQTANAEFVDTLVDVAFSADSQHIALLETSAIYHERHPAGWRGNLSLFGAGDGTLKWSVSVDARVTGDQRSLRDAGFGMGFFTEIAFLDDTRIVCGTARGWLLIYDAENGQVTRHVDVGRQASIRSVSLDSNDRILWVVLNDGTMLTLEAVV